MTTSSPELAPRGMDFLYSRHRLNVATSRARCVAIVVASPDLFRVAARTPEQMRLANALCLAVEAACDDAVGAPTGRPAPEAPPLVLFPPGRRGRAGLTTASAADQLAAHPGREDPGARLDLVERHVLVGAVGDADVARTEDRRTACRRR